MEKTIRERKNLQTKVRQNTWQRIVLLLVLGYEAAGALLGGSFLIAAPDGRLMDMPVGIMHGVFIDFKIPGMILFGLGVLNTIAFFAVLRRSRFDQIFTILALGAMAIWFWVEIAILQNLHWLHVMWGFPVLLGGLAAVLAVPARKKALLACGILSSLLYVAANVVTVMLYEGYSPVSQTVSELSAIGAPTRALWVSLLLVYALLVVLFGLGIRQSSAGNRRLKTVGTLFILFAVVGLFWPPMHQRDVLAAGGGTITDTLHIAFTMVTVPLMMLAIGFGATAFGKPFRTYSIITLAILLVAGIVTGMDGPKISENLPTPLIGVWERINIGVYMLWVAVLAIVLLQEEKIKESIALPSEEEPKTIVKAGKQPIRKPVNDGRVPLH